MASPEENEEEGRGRRREVLHGLAVPYPAQGHILPLMNLCHRLTTLIPHLHITFVNTSQNHRRMLESQIHHKEERIRLVEIDGGLPPEVHTMMFTLDAFYKASEDLMGPLDLLMQRLDQPVSFILSDSIMSWTHSLARKFGIPRVAFVPFSAINFYISSHLQTILAQLPPPGEGGQWDSKEVESLQVVLPALPPLHFNDLFFVKDYRIVDPLVHFMNRQFPPMREASFILINSFHSLEKPIFEALNISWPIVVHPIGPLLPNPSFKMASLFKEERSCLAWLDIQRKPKCVLYVSFGSIHEVKGRQFHELALGLEASQYPILWVIRDYCKEEEKKMFPDPDFLDRIGDRCLVVRWCPQLEVLSHPSVGAFLTHCGWNSIMESIASGVPMACWPRTGEQRLNARFVVEHWKVGMTFHSQEEGIVGRKEVERVVRNVFEDEELQNTTFELSEVAKASVMEGGSSSRNLEGFVEGIRAMNIPTSL